MLVGGGIGTYDRGGGIFSIGRLTLTNSTVTGNTVPPYVYPTGVGGGIWAWGLSEDYSTTLTNSTVSGNVSSKPKCHRWLPSGFLAKQACG